MTPLFLLIKREEMRKRVAAILTVLVCGVSYMWGVAPDFAFPKKVEAAAKTDLSRALSQGNGDGVVNALVRMGLGATAVSGDSLAPFIRRVEAVADKEKSAATRALLRTLLAQIYTQIYQSGQSKYNARAAVGSSTDDYKLWGRRDFVGRVSELSREALEDYGALEEVALSGYKSAVKLDRQAVILYPTVGDFVALRAIDNLRNFAEGPRILNAGLLRAPGDTTLYPQASAERPLRQILDIYRMWRQGARHEAAKINADIRALEFIEPFVFDAGPKDELQAIFLERYKENTTSPYAVEYLMQAQIPDLGTREAGEYYGWLKAFVKANPMYYNLAAVKNRMTIMTNPMVEVKVNTLCSPDGKIPVEVTLINVPSCTLKFYDVTARVGNTIDDYYDPNKGLGATPAARLKIGDAGKGRSLPYKTVYTDTVSLPRVGRYAVLTSAPGFAAPNSIPLLRCTRLFGSSISYNGGNRAWVVNPATGEPQKDVEIGFCPQGSKVYSALKGTTDQMGQLPFKLTQGGTLQPRRGDDTASPSWRVYPYNERATTATRANLFTALGLYHPGDTVQWSVVAYRSSPAGEELATDAGLAVVMYDANFQPVDTMKITTDSWGRGEGRFTLPSEGLQGRFTLQAQALKGMGWENVGERSFMVSDYKLPTFEVEVERVKRPTTPSDSAVIYGRATAFSGFAIGDGEVEAQVSCRTGFWLGSRQSAPFATVKARTGEDGRFEVVIPGTVLMGAPTSRGIYCVEVAITSATGETQQTRATFATGSPLTLVAEIPSVIDAKAPVRATLKALDARSEEVDCEVRYQITGRNAVDTVPTVRGTMSAERGSGAGEAMEELLWGLPSGTYTAKFSAAEAQDTAIVSFTVYRNSDSVSPRPELLWLPQREVTADEQGKARIAVEAGAADLWVLVSASDSEGKLLLCDWLMTNPGMNAFTLQLPEGARGAVVQMQTTLQCKTECVRATVEPWTSRRRISVAIETFRDHVQPGAKEQLRVKVTPQGGAEARSAVMLDMSNKAIEMLAPNVWYMDVQRAGMEVQSIVWPQLSTPWCSMALQQGLLRTINMMPPEFQLYGRSFVPYATNRLLMGARGSRLLTKEARGAMSMDSDVSDIIEGLAAKTEAILEGLKEDANQARARQSGFSGGDAEREERFRPSEVPLAFFQPCLETDSAGNATYTYTVPDANTTWMLRALAYNRALETSTSNVAIVASKPLMVSLNAPRFVRCGDRLTVRASVMNNSDTVISAGAVMEILHPLTGEVIGSQTFTLDSLGAGKAQVVAMDYDATQTLAAVTMRVRGESGNYSDGEQRLVALLPSAQDVVSSEMFYIPAREAQFRLPLKEASGDGTVLLNFTENPTWQVVSALPGLREGKIKSSTEAADAIFSAAVARELVRRYPEVARTLRLWAENPQDSALVSALRRNEELKQVVLSATPWVSASLSQTERLQRLSLLLDNSECKRVIAEAITTLGKTQRAGGGWAWTPNYGEASGWCTMQVLRQMGRLAQMNILPNDEQLKRQINKALGYIDAEAVSAYGKRPNGDYRDYALTRSMFVGKVSTAAERVVNAAIQYAIAHWRDDGVAMKGADALLLRANGYEATARQILASLRELATSTPEKGMWWQQMESETGWGTMGKVGATALVLRAFQAVEPGSGDIDLIRQWLVLQKVNNDWGGSAATTAVVAAIMMSGSEWTDNSRATAIRVGDTLLEPDKVERATGSFTMAITPLVGVGATLAIDRQAPYPSVGAVMTMERLPMGEIKAQGCQEVSVGKQLKVLREGEWVEARDFTLGERVRVSLTLKVESDLSYVVITDPRAGCLEPVEQLPTPVWAEGLCFYRENQDSQTCLFIDRLPRGTYILSYDMFATQSGSFASGSAALQSEYNPAVAAHSGAGSVEVK